MEEFADVARARESYALFAEAMDKGRDILLRAGIAQAALLRSPISTEFSAV